MHSLVYVKVCQYEEEHEIPIDVTSKKGEGMDEEE
jgi:hypothetical protein